MKLLSIRELIEGKKLLFYESRSIIIIIILLICSCTNYQLSRQNNPVYAFITYPIEKIRPEEVPAPCLNKNIRLAGNEYESVLFGISNQENTDKQIIKINLKKSLKSCLKYKIFLVEYYEVKTPSRWFDLPGKRGRWPDPIIPLKISKIDEYNSFVILKNPINVPAFENHGFILDFYMPAQSEKYNDNWNIEFVLADGMKLNVRLIINPYQFDIPKKSILTSVIGLNSSYLAKKHKELSKIEFDSDLLCLQYKQLLAQYRFFLREPFDKKIKYERQNDGNIIFNWSEFDIFIEELLTGKIYSASSYANYFAIPNVEEGLSDQEEKEYYNKYIDHARKKGWLKKTYFHIADEPLIKEFPAIIERIIGFKKINPDIKILITEPYSIDLDPYIDIWCPDLVFIGDSVPFMPVFAYGSNPHLEWQINHHPSIYAKLRRRGKGVWLYSCSSAQAFDYPNLFIDSKAQYQRIIPWIMFKYDFTGFLYWRANYNYLRKGNPWQDQFNYGTNGDGNMLYPGIPEYLHIDKHVPIPSLRLLIMREGFEDYEYLSLLKKLSNEQVAKNSCNKLVINTLIWEKKSDKLLKIREVMGNKIELLSEKYKDK